MNNLAVTAASPVDRSGRALDAVNFFLADVQTGLGPFLAVYLSARHWDEQQIGFVLAVGGIAGIVAQTPAGALIDAAHAKRAIVAVAVACLALGAVITAAFPSFWPILGAQILIGGTSSVFAPAIAAISLGIVGRRHFDRQQGRNQTFNAAGNVFAAVAMGLLGYYVSNESIFLFVVAFTVPTLISLFAIDPRRIDFTVARGSDGAAEQSPAAGIRELLRDRPLAWFLSAAVLFHFANAALLPLLGELLGKGQGRASMAYMSACVIVTQLVVACIAYACGSLAASRGRKPLLLVAFAVLPVRCLLYTLTHNAAALVAIQILDGIGAGIFGVVSTLVVADLTRGTGRFNLALGAIATAVGIGASISQGVVGSLVLHTGYASGFVFSAVIAALAFAVLWRFVPETKDAPASNSTPFTHSTSRRKS